MQDHPRTGCKVGAPGVVAIESGEGDGQDMLQGGRDKLSKGETSQSSSREMPMALEVGWSWRLCSRGP